MRVARPTDNLTAIASMYREGLRFEVLAKFRDHAGFDGVVLGHPGAPYHLESTSRRGHEAEQAPNKEHLLIFYIPDEEKWAVACGNMLAAGFLRTASNNPYWEQHGRTFEDLDGHRVVLQKSEWNK